jgi:hypothetical protein
MELKIQIPDDLYSRLKAANNGQHERVQKKIAGLVEEFHNVGSDGYRYFVVDGANRRAIEKVFQTTIETADQLVRKVQNLSRVGIGDVHRPLTDGESIQLESQASFWGVPPSEFIQQTVDRVLDEALGRV